MRILVTGATGFIGNYVIKYLLSKNHKIVAISRNEKKAKQQSWYNDVNFQSFDISNYPKELNLFMHFGKPDLLIHLAWDGLPNFLDMIHIDKNLMSHYYFIKNYVETGGNHILVTGTCLEYGMKNGELFEEMSTEPNCAYAIAKDSLRRFIEEIGKKENTVFQWVRLFYMYGNGQYSKAIFPQLETAVENGDKIFNMSGGEQLRDYLPVEIIAEQICAIALQKEVSGIINCSSGEPISIRKLVEEYLAKKQYSIKLNLGYYPYPSYEPMAFWGNNSKLKQIIL